MSDFDDLRGLADDEEQSGEYVFDDVDADEFDFEYGEEIGAASGFVERPGPINQLLGTMTAQERMMLTIMLFGNVLVLGIALLLVTGRVG